MGISLAHLTILDARVEDAIPAAAAGGFDGLALRIFSGSNPPYARQVAGDRPLIRSLAGQASEAGVPVTEVESFVLRPEVDLDLFAAGLDASAALGATRLLAVSYDAERSRAAERLHWLGVAAAERGIRVGLEFIPYSSARTLAEALALREAAAHPNVGLIVDALHLARSGGSPEDLRALDPSAFVFAQLADARAQTPPGESLAAESRTDRLLPGEGSLALDRLLDVLPPGLPLSLEAPTRELAQLAPIRRAEAAGRHLRAFLGRHRHSGVGAGEGTTR